MKAKTLLTFKDLWVGDRFTLGGPVWTKLDHRTARRHCAESVALGARGYGYIGDAVCGIEPEQEVEFEPINTHAQLIAALETARNGLQDALVNLGCDPCHITERLEIVDAVLAQAGGERDAARDCKNALKVIQRDSAEKLGLA